MRYAAEATLEADRLIIHLQIAHSTWRHVQYDLTITGVARRHPDPGIFDVHQQMGRTVVVDHPLIKRSKQVGTAGIHDYLSWQAAVKRPALAMLLTTGLANPPASPSAH